MKVQFTKVKPDAVIPEQVKGSVGLDIYPCFEEQDFVIPAHTTALVPTGIKTLLPEGFFMLLEERGSTGSKGIKRSAGVIDNDFRGEIFVAITNANNKPLIITKEDQTSNGDVIIYPYKKAIAQGIVLPYYIIQSEEISEDEYDKHTTDRGTGALGSSGK